MTLIDPIAGDPLALSNGKTSVQFIHDVNDAVNKRTSSDVLSPDGFSPVTEQIIANGESTTGWAATAGTLTLDATNFTTGTHSVKNTNFFTGSATVKLWFTPTSPIAVGNYEQVALDHMGWAGHGTIRLVVASGADLTGTVVKSELLPLHLGWITMRVPLGAITSIGSVGLLNEADYVPATSEQQPFNIDNVRLMNLTEVDTALSVGEGVVIPPGYVPTGAENPPNLGTTRSVIDLRPNNTYVSRLGGKRHIREFGPDETGATSSDAAFSNAIAALGTNETLVLSPGAQYNLDYSVYLKSNMRIEGNGAAVVQNGWFDNASFVIEGVENVEVRDVRVFGRHSADYASSNVLSTATDTGVVTMNWFVGRDPQGRFEMRWKASDTTHVADDFKMDLWDMTDDVSIGSATYTLTGTPTWYTCYGTPIDLGHILGWKLTKLTSTTNTITATHINVPGIVEYDGGGTHDNGGGFWIQSNLAGTGDIRSKHIRIIDCSVEGVPADSCQIQQADDVLVRGLFARACCRQGFSDVIGNGAVLEDFVIREVGRSGVDVEPYAEDWEVSNLIIRNGEIHNAANLGITIGGSGINHDIVIDNITHEGVRGDGSASIDACWIAGANTDRVHLRNLVSTTGGVSVDADDCTAFGIHAETFTLGSSARFQGGDIVTTQSLDLGTNTDAIVTNISNGMAVPPGVTVGAAYPTTPAAAVIAPYHQADFPANYKGPMYSDVWVPGGFNNHSDPSYNLKSLSGTSTKGQNLTGTVAVTGSASSKVVAFPVSTRANFTSFELEQHGATGTLEEGETYYYRVTTRSAYSGGPMPLAEQNITVDTGKSAVAVRGNGWRRDDLDYLVEGMTILRGTSTGVYTYRIDYTSPPTAPYWAYYNTHAYVIDIGQGEDGSFTPADESGYEPDTDYRVFVSADWATTLKVSSKTIAGFTVDFGTNAPGGGGNLDWFIVR